MEEPRRDQPPPASSGACSEPTDGPDRRHGWILWLGLCLALAASGCAPAAPPPALGASLLVITVDSLRVDRLAPWNPAGVAVPHLSALARRGVLFDNAWTTAPWTAPAVVSVFTGLYPPSHGVVVRDDTTPPELPTLPRLLASHGYRLGNFSFFSEVSYYRNLGFAPPEPGVRHGGGAALAEWLDAMPAGDPSSPFLAWVHLIEPHLPYGASGYYAKEVSVAGSSGLEEAQRRAAVPVGSVEFAPGDPDRLRELYDIDVAAMDEALGEVLEVLDARGLTDQTLVLLVADHGEELFEDGWIGHASTAIEAKLIPEITRVPMILVGPGVPGGGRVTELVQPVDAFSSLVALLGLEPPEIVDGRVLPGLAVEAASIAEPRAYFDSSSGGNLTPIERVADRIQGVTDGRCLLSVESRPGTAAASRLLEVGDRPCSESDRAELEASLAAWQAQQATQRLALLERYSPRRPPSDPEVAALEVGLEVLRPAPGEVLEWAASQGTITLAWQGDAGEYWVEYEVGSGLRQATGRFVVERPQIGFGPFPVGFWNDIAEYRPFRFRVLDLPGQRRSPWNGFDLRTHEAGR